MSKVKINYSKSIFQFFSQQRAKLIYILLFLFVCLGFFSVNSAFWKGLKYNGDALTSDEVSHIPAGLYYLKTGRYFINPEHPFLIKDIAALPLVLMGAKIPPLPRNETDNPQWSWGREVLFHAGNKIDQMALFARLNVLLLNAGLLFLVYLYLKKFFGLGPALLSAFFLVFSPTQLGHSSLVTNDTTAAFTLILGVLAFTDLLDSLAKSRKILFKKTLFSSFFIFLALTAKFSGVLILPVLFLTALIYVLVKYRLNLKMILKYSFYFILVNFLAFIFLGAAYGLHTRNMESEGIAKQLRENYPSNWPLAFEEFLIKSTQIPGVKVFNKGITQYLIGFFMVKSRVEAASQSLYFMKHIYGSEGAGMKYFPLIYLFKTTPGALFLSFVSLLFAFFYIKKRVVKLISNSSFLGLSILFIVYSAVSLTSRFQIGIRHIMPLIFLIFIFTACSVVELIKTIKQEKFRIFTVKTITAACALIVFSNLITFPHYLSYFNFLAGGTDNGYKIATDSNYDWAGQDLKRLAQWIKENQIDKVYLQIFTNLEPKYYLGRAWKPFNLKTDPLPPQGSLIAVSAFELQDTNYRKELASRHKYFQLEDYQIDRVGKTIFIFRVP